jgi:tRNA dimethylallyltransferase
MSAIGYRDIKTYIDGKLTLEQALEDWKLHEVQYAKRQIVWFKKEKQIVWFDLAGKALADQVKLKVQKWLKNG